MRRKIRPTAGLPLASTNAEGPLLGSAIVTGTPPHPPVREIVFLLIGVAPARLGTARANTAPRHARIANPRPAIWRVSASWDAIVLPSLSLSEERSSCMGTTVRPGRVGVFGRGSELAPPRGGTTLRPRGGCAPGGAALRSLYADPDQDGVAQRRA